MLMFSIVLTPTLAGGKYEPTPYIGDLGGPAAILFTQTLASPKALDDPLDLQKLGLRILGVVRTRQRAFGAGTQLALKVANIRVGRRQRFEHDISPRVVVDLCERLVDTGDELLDRLALSRQL